ncbi:MAG TPA: TQO small subunit DoxD [bacterium]|nr:TQO small subunit DoxD [bacterium]
MRTNPFLDAIGFLTQARWTTGVFWILLVMSVLAAWANWRCDPSQRSAERFWVWVARFSVGTMWWVQSLWKLPPTYTDRPDGSGGLRFWVGEMAKYAAFTGHRDFVRDVVQPHFYFFAPQVYLSEVLIGITLILGVFSRLGAFLGLLMAINLWLGLYRDPSEWLWTYVFLIVIQLLFFLYRPGRSLGVDAMLLRRLGKGPAAGWGYLVRLLS